MKKSMTALAASMILLVACAKQEDSTPPSIAINIDFQSTSAAVATEDVKVYIFEGLLVCNDLIRLRQTEQGLPPRIVETPSVTPCQLHNNEQNTVELNLKKDYTMLAVGQIGGKDALAGCTQQLAFGQTLAADITIALIDDRQKLATSQCAKLSDKCAGLCK